MDTKIRHVRRAGPHRALNKKNGDRAKCITCDEFGEICCGGPFSTRIRNGKKLVYVENPVCVDCHEAMGRHPSK